MPVHAMPLLIGFCVKATVVLAAACLITLAMRRAAAATRHFVWTCAIVGAALVPVAILAGAEWQMPVHPVVGGTITNVVAFDDVVVPTTDSSRPVVRAQAASSTRDYIGLAMGIWLAGSAGILGYLLIGTLAVWRLRRAVFRVSAAWVHDAHALARTLQIRRQLEFVESAWTTMPMVCGFWRPFVVMPLTARDWSAERIRVVLLHELAHVKRRDGLTQLLAQLLCAAYWFNPMVWLAARRLREEREHACDDVVLSAGMCGSDYARHLLDIARAAMPPRTFSPVAAAALPMAHRSQLEARLLAILDPTKRRSPAFYAQVAALAGVLIVAVPVAAVQPLQVTPTLPQPISAAMLTTARPLAQGNVPAPESLPAFDAISIRPNKAMVGWVGIGGQFQPSRFETTNVTLKTLIKLAYARPGATPNTALNLLDHEIIGGPQWLNVDKFDVVATTPTDTQPTPHMRQRQMLQRMLAERFKLAAHWETRELPAYALMRVRADGPLASGLTLVTAEDCEKDKPTPAGTFVPGDLRCDAIIFDGQLAGGITGLGARGAPMERLAQTLVSLRGVTGLDRMVLNRTGLEGNYAFALKFAGSRVADDLEHPTLFTALQEQLGLKLEPVRAPVSVLVIDRSEKPEPN